MQQHHIYPSNALKATHYLLELSIDAIEQHYRQDAHCWISNLQEALHIYKAHTEQTFNSPLINTTNFYQINQCLQRVSYYANNMVHILNSYAKENLAKYLLLNQDLAVAT